jgi:hypothetical protein
VGVVENMYRRAGGGEQVDPDMFLPIGLGAEQLSIVARMNGTTLETLAPKARQIAREIAPDTSCLDSVFLAEFG